MSNLLIDNTIKKSGLYIIDDNSPSEIIILDDVYVSLIMLDTSKNFCVKVDKNSGVDFYGFFCENSPSKIEFFQIGDKSKLNVKMMYLTTKNNLSSNVRSIVSSNSSKSNLEIINIVKNNKLEIDTGIEIKKGFREVEGYLNQSNIFIGDNGSVRGIPRLFVDSDDIKASHSCKIHRIDEDKLFYLNSRGLDKKLGLNILIESNFNNLFKCINMLDKELLDNIYDRFINNL